MKYLDDLETILLKDLVPDQKLENCFWVKSDSQLRSDEFFHDLNQKDQERIFSLIETIIHTERHDHFAGALNSFNLSSNWTFFIEQRWEGAWFILGAVKGGFEDTACPSFIKKFYANQLGFLDKFLFSKTLIWQTVYRNIKKNEDFFEECLKVYCDENDKWMQAKEECKEIIAEPLFYDHLKPSKQLLHIISKNCSKISEKEKEILLDYLIMGIYRGKFGSAFSSFLK